MKVSAIAQHWCDTCFLPLNFQKLFRGIRKAIYISNRCTFPNLSNSEIHAIASMITSRTIHAGLKILFYVTDQCFCNSNLSDLCYYLRARFRKTYIPKVGHLSKIEAPTSKPAIQTPNHLSLSTEGTCTLSSLLVQNTHLEFCCCTSSVLHNTDPSFFKSKCDIKVRRKGSSSALGAISTFQQPSTT